MEVSGFLSQIIEAHNDLIEQEKEAAAPLPSEYVFCKICRHHIAGGGHCRDCTKAIQRGYQISALAGRCRTGSDQTGVRWHARLVEGDQPTHKALCGYAPKGLSGGWSDWRPDGREVTCPKCLKRLRGK